MWADENALPLSSLTLTNQVHNGKPPRPPSSPLKAVLKKPGNAAPLSESIEEKGNDLAPPKLAAAEREAIALREEKRVLQEQVQKLRRQLASSQHSEEGEEDSADALQSYKESLVHLNAYASGLREQVEELNKKLDMRDAEVDHLKATVAKGAALGLVQGVQVAAVHSGEVEVVQVCGADVEVQWSACFDFVPAKSSVVPSRDLDAELSRQLVEVTIEPLHISMRLNLEGVLGEDALAAAVPSTAQAGLLSQNAAFTLGRSFAEDKEVEDTFEPGAALAPL